MKFVSKLLRNIFVHVAFLYERPLLAQGKQLALWIRSLENVASLEDAEFSVFSQGGDDGILQYLVSHIPLVEKGFVEFGVEDYTESTTRFLMMNNNWSGLVMDGSDDNIARLKRGYYYWQHDLTAQTAFVTAENINELIAKRPFKDVSVLVIDIDGNDYWVWKALDSIKPVVTIIEYNSVFGCKRAITIPYSADFNRTRAHYSNLYFGASLAALVDLGNQMGYAFVGSNSAGTNAFFVRDDRLNSQIRRVSTEEGYRESKLRESRGPTGRFTYLRGEDRIEILRGLPVINILTNEREIL